jgi:hypothetical protein
MVCAAMMAVSEDSVCDRLAIFPVFAPLPWLGDSLGL